MEEWHHLLDGFLGGSVVGVAPKIFRSRIQERVTLALRVDIHITAMKPTK